MNHNICNCYGITLSMSTMACDKFLICLRFIFKTCTVLKFQAERVGYKEIIKDSEGNTYLFTSQTLCFTLGFGVKIVVT